MGQKFAGAENQDPDDNQGDGADNEASEHGFAYLLFHEMLSFTCGHWV
jgi:hypothetical protein